jgi:hypothetical protein
MKTVQMIAAVVAVLLNTSTSNAGSLIEKPCGNKCAAPQPTVTQPVIGGVKFRRLDEPLGRPIMVGASNRPDYESHSRMVIRSRYGTSVINSTYRSYSR